LKWLVIQIKLKMNNRLNSKVIIITGGTKGVGKGVALECAKLGAKIIIAGRDASNAKLILNEIQLLGSEGFFIKTDLQVVGDCERLFRETFLKYKRIDGFFNYAGITTSSSLLECEEDHFNSIFDTNVKGALFCCKYAVKYMIESGGGSIVLTGSPHAWAGDKDRVAYACSKGTMITLTNHLAQHYATNGIRANYITMGWTPTDGEIELRKKSGMSEIELRNWASSIIPAGRMTEIDDLVPGIIYLLSDDSKMVSGSNFRITGGWFL
jgi:NAD(P)-dependent dehydrogenase (short-subunit alcohol dehydrogenase family)